MKGQLVQHSEPPPVNENKGRLLQARRRDWRGARSFPHKEQRGKLEGHDDWAVCN